MTPATSPRTLADIIDDLTPIQEAALKAVQVAKLNRDNARDGYGRAIQYAQKMGVSYGAQAMRVGDRKENLWRWQKAYEKRLREKLAGT